MTNRNIRRVQRRIFEALGRRSVKEGFYDALPTRMRARRIGKKIVFHTMHGWRMAAFLRGYRTEPVTLVLD